MTNAAHILNDEAISESVAASLLAAYPGLDALLGRLADQRAQTNQGVRVRRFTAAEVAKWWSAPLKRVMVGLVFFETSGMTQFGRTAVYIEKRSGQLSVDTW